MTSKNTMTDIDLVKRLNNRSLVFVGMMGCGKTAIGRIVAEKLGLRFFDADEEIEKAAGMSVADYFAAYGEEEFRDGERKVIARLLDNGQCVLALGGGAFLAPSTREIIADKALSLWLRANVEILYSRVMRRPGKRPLLQTDDPKSTLARLLKQREPCYALADITVDTSTTSKNVTCERVVRAINSYLENEKSYE